MKDTHGMVLVGIGPGPRIYVSETAIAQLGVRRVREGVRSIYDGYSAHLTRLRMGRKLEREAK